MQMAKKREVFGFQDPKLEPPTSVEYVIEGVRYSMEQNGVTRKRAVELLHEMFPGVEIIPLQLLDVPMSEWWTKQKPEIPLYGSEALGEKF
jgi:hypothetical protein